MSTFPPDVLPIEHTLRFLDRVLPQRSRVLEVGCGRGALAARLQARGLEVTALDVSPEAVAAARALGVHAVAGDFLEFVAEPFDAVLFSRSLHHIASLPRAVDRAHALLGPGGLVIAEEFAVERMDRQTARYSFRHARDPESLGQSFDIFRPAKWGPVLDTGDALGRVHLQCEHARLSCFFNSSRHRMACHHDTLSRQEKRVLPDSSGRPR